MASLVPRPLPVFQCFTLKNGKRIQRETLKNWEWPGDEATVWPYFILTNYFLITLRGQAMAETVSKIGQFKI